MSTDFQDARVALGARLRELRDEAGLTGRAMADRTGWQQSKISKLETGRQTAQPADLDVWVEAVGRPDVSAELHAQLGGLETSYRSWRRQLSGGHRARQEEAVAETRRTKRIRAFESARVPGLLQTADYARHLLALNATFSESPRDTDEAVRTRMRRQEALYEPGRRFQFIVWEAALHVAVCPPVVMAAQLDRLVGAIGLDTIELGIIPLGAQLARTPAHGFWIYDDRLVIVETINAEMWLDSESDIALYSRAWDFLRRSAVYGHEAHRSIARVRMSLDIS
ncbi:transcriptional regulator with XRE-family HTH domain [Kitasatospora sp. MAA4]|uniref:helix-turn-helix domain-containing protein n=1 Tax=Kitasatospora sp. MAA4 TaxID=3035093 RepID=UPI00247424D7|nr:Scr1 family TA system antitoxin-like transcriptional regulator [Kitasatospora sp. MAA4]MDH6130739.1 transcriptional regulator with XRE-family HTH domain [Kitasatospora sp. MAA4]